MKCSGFVFDKVHLLYYKCHKMVDRGGSYIDSPDWIKSKKPTTNPINKKNIKGFQYAGTVTLNHEEIKKDPQRITKFTLFINKYNKKGINFSSEKDDWKQFEKGNVTNISCLYFKT